MCVIYNKLIQGDISSLISDRACCRTAVELCDSNTDYRYRILWTHTIYRDILACIITQSVRYCRSEVQTLKRKCATLNLYVRRRRIGEQLNAY